MNRDTRTHKEIIKSKTEDGQDVFTWRSSSGDWHTSRFFLSPKETANEDLKLAKNKSGR